MANTDETPPRGASATGLIVGLVVMTVVGGGAGAGLGLMQAGSLATVAEAPKSEAPDRANALAWDPATAVVRLEPVIVNLAAPPGARIRLDTAMVFHSDMVSDVERMKATLASDMVAFLRTVTLGELEGASAFNFLRDDLNERARIASAGAVKEVLIETMVIQ